jgi:hypothetical protein
MDIKRKTCDIQNWGGKKFLDMSYTNIDALVPSLYHDAEIRSIQVF